jgi:hypothetical protein
MVANVGNTILGTFNAVQNASLNRERIANARLEREQNQLKFRQLEDLDAHDTLIRSGTQNGYIDSTQGFKLNRETLFADLTGEDQGRRELAASFATGVANRLNKNDPFTMTGMEKNENGKFIMTGRNPDGSPAPVTDNGTADDNDLVTQFDPEGIVSSVNTIYNGRILPRSSVDPVVYKQWNIAGDAIGAAIDTAEATGSKTASRDALGVINQSGNDAEAMNVANQITTGLGGKAPEPKETEPVEEPEAVEPLLLNATRDQKRNIERLRMVVARGEKNPATQTNPTYAKRLEKQKAELAALEQEVNDTPTGRLESGEQRRYAALNKRIANLNRTLEGKDTSKGIAATQAGTLAKLTKERDALVGKARELANPLPPEVENVANQVEETTGGDLNEIAKNPPKVSQSEAQAIAKSAQDAGVRTPADIVKLGPRQRIALIASIAAYTPEARRVATVQAFANYLETSNPGTSGKDALTARTSAGTLRRGLRNDARTAADQYSTDVATVGKDYVAPIVNGVWNEEDREFIAPTQDARVAATQLRSLAATAKQGGSLGLAAANEYLNGIMPLLIAEGKQTGDGFFGRIADIFRDDANLQIGNMADLIVVEYDGKDPIRLKFEDPAGGLYEEELTWKELAKVADSATRNAIDLAYRKRLEAESKQQ